MNARSARSAATAASRGAKLARTCVACCLAIAALAAVLAAREREPNSVYADRRAKLAAQLGAPVVVFGYTGKEESSAEYVFNQEPNFYYLTGHNEENATLVEVPAGASAKGWQGATDILFLPPRDPEQEKWNGPRMAPNDPDIRDRTGFADVEPSDALRDTLRKLQHIYPEMFTVFPAAEETGYPHEQDALNWLNDNVSGEKWQDAREAIGAMRLVKSPGELALMQHAIDVSVDAHLEAMRMMRPGLYEYQVAARMVEIHDWGGCETEAYAPIVGSGPDSVILHYDKLSRRIEDGDIVLLDVGGQFSGYASDITRTLPANGKYTPRQREIYEIVLGAQNAAFAAVKPGMTLARGGRNSLFEIAYNYINTHGKDREGRSLGRYFIHGLGHPVGLDVHDNGDNAVGERLMYSPLKPGMVITLEPGIYIPEENIGVRIEDDVLVTETGARFLTERLPRDPDEIEKIMAEGRAEREKNGTSSSAAPSR
ncbi:MAG: aminopeptidase P N-terminal domain-containing protein [Candidatus Acidiferrales bacterium]